MLTVLGEKCATVGNLRTARLSPDRTQQQNNAKGVVKTSPGLTREAGLPWVIG